jgi:hypothetical protein
VGGEMPAASAALATRQLATRDAFNQEGSTVDRHAGMLVNVHPGLRLRIKCRNPTLAALSQMNNFHTFHNWVSAKIS